MDTTAAAEQAKVTTATIRNWARRGVIAATKTAGRWAIDAASLAHRIAIGARRAARRAKQIVFSTETLTAIGGRRWQKNGMDRVYLNDWARFLAPLEIEQYKTGNISWAAWNGEEIANRQAGLLLGSIDKVWFDAADGKLYCRYGYGQSRVATREEVWSSVVSGIRTAIAAL